jgi:hypothetical protein
MRSARAFQIVGGACVRAATIAVVLVVAMRAAPAHADNVDELVRQLEDDRSDKVRLSAALNLTKLGNPRAILPLAAAVERDSDKSVRGAAAVGLGKLVTDRTDPKVKAKAIAALTRAKDGDDIEFVKAQAARALKAIGATETIAPPSGAGIYVNIGPMSSRTGDSAADPKLRALMVKIATRTMAKVASHMATTWPGGVPTKPMLDAKSTQGFYVDGTLNDLKVKESRSSTTVSCKINMLLASFPDKSIFGLLSGGASVQASGSATDIALAREDCVSAVVEDLIAKKIVPTITTKAGSP